MKQITFQLDIPLSIGLSFQIVPRRTLTEDQVFGPACFEKLVSTIKEMGCQYRLEVVPETVLIEGNASFGR